MKEVKSYGVAITKDSKSNLCDDCRKNFATCNSEIIGWGNGKGNDNVIMCIGYEQIEKSSEKIIATEIHIRQ
jgi:hypothetical protein